MYFLTQKKYAVVKPLLKAGKDRDAFAFDRPLYNSSFLSEVLETECLKQLSDHREIAVTRVYNDLIVNKSRGKDTIIVLLDLSAAFDTVDQDILLIH